MQAIQPMFYCPSRRPAGAYGGQDYTQGNGFWPAGNAKPLSAPYLSAKTDYAGNGGTVGFNEMAMPPDCNGCPGELFNANDTRVTPQATIQASAALIKQANYQWYLTPTPNPNGGKARNPGFVQNTNQSVSFTGVIWYRSQVALKQIPDGTSKVYLFGEKYVDQISALNTINAGGNGESAASIMGLARSDPPGGQRGAYCQTPAPTAAVALTATLVDQENFPPQQDAPFPASVWAGGSSGGPGGNNAPASMAFDNAATFRFGGPHSGGFNMVFCDGSVHSIIYEVDTRVHLSVLGRSPGWPIAGRCRAISANSASG